MEVRDRLLLRPHEAAEVLGVSRSKIYQMLAAEELRSVHIGASRRIALCDLEAYVDGLRAAQAAW